jgi:accessory gene regulator protein AgrB
MKTIVLVVCALASMFMFVLIPFVFRDWGMTDKDAALFWFISGACLTASTILFAVDQDRKLK